MSGGFGFFDGMFFCSYFGSFSVGGEKIDGWDGWMNLKLGNY